MPSRIPKLQDRSGLRKCSIPDVELTKIASTLLSPAVTKDGAA